MMRLDAVMTLFPDLDASELEIWVAQRWVRPSRGSDEVWLFGDIDVARVRLIYDLRRGLDTPEETISLVLSLLDQVYELRGALKDVSQAIALQPADVQRAVHAAVFQRRGGT